MTILNSITLVPRFLDINEAAHYLSLSKWSLYRLVELRQVPFIPLSPSERPGKAARRPSLRFDIKALDRWMEKKTINPLP